MTQALEAPRTAIVGGTSGIGLASAELLLRRGHEVVVAGRSEERPAAALKQLEKLEELEEVGPGRVSGRTVDAADGEALSAFFAAVGPFDNLVVTLTANGGITSLAELAAAEASALGRPGRPEELAHAVAFLVENTFTTGVVLPVDGVARLGASSLGG